MSSVKRPVVAWSAVGTFQVPSNPFDSPHMIFGYRQSCAPWTLPQGPHAGSGLNQMQLPCPSPYPPGMRGADVTTADLQDTLLSFVHLVCTSVRTARDAQAEQSQATTTHTSATLVKSCWAMLYVGIRAEENDTPLHKHCWHLRHEMPGESSDSLLYKTIYQA